jgi:hypothetical protein
MAIDGHYPGRPSLSLHRPIKPVIEPCAHSFRTRTCPAPLSSHARAAALVSPGRHHCRPLKHPAVSGVLLTISPFFSFTCKAHSSSNSCPTTALPRRRIEPHQRSAVARARIAGVDLRLHCLPASVRFTLSIAAR